MDNKENKNVEEYRKVINSFLKLCSNNIIRLSFSPLGFGYAMQTFNENVLDDIDINDLKFIKDPNSKEIIRKFIRQLRKEVLFHNSSDFYKEYVDKFIEENPDTVDSINIKCRTNLNLLDTIKYSILPRVNNSLEIDAYSILCELSLRNKNNSVISENIQLTLEDLKYMKSVFNKAIDDIEKIKTKLDSND